MKRYSTIILFFFLFISIITLSSGCNKKKDRHEFKFDIIEIEECEYIEYTGAMGYKHIEHKGNCLNPIHAYNRYMR